MVSKAVYIGTSGFSFQDWRGRFYPEEFSRGQWLNFYARYFHAVEINSTYYKIPHPKVFFHLAQKTPSDFHFIVKLHKESTHIRNENERAVDELFSATEPVRESGKLKGFLGQFPYSFKFSEVNLNYLCKTREYLGQYPFFVEFRHTSWNREETFRTFERNDISYVCVDEPMLPNLIPPQKITTTGIGYVRLHGRNKEAWWDSSRGDRYDYLYTREELEEWKRNIQDMLDYVNRMYVFFNNCHHGQAAQNALEMQEMLV
jgi:uncharacterized protein YecE (DUF72 family)